MSRQKVQANFFLFSRQIAVVQTIPDIFRQYPTIPDNLRQGQSISMSISQSLWLSDNLLRLKIDELLILTFWIGWQVHLSLANHIANLSDFHGKIVGKRRRHCSRVCAICHDGRANFLLLPVQNMLSASKFSNSNDHTSYLSFFYTGKIFGK